MEPTNNSSEGSPLRYALMPFSGITFTIKEKMGFCDGLLKRRMFQHFFLNSMKAFVEVILLEGLLQKRSYKEGIIGLQFLRM
jgi:hypothetical protein